MKILHKTPGDSQRLLLRPLCSTCWFVFGICSREFVLVFIPAPCNSHMSTTVHTLPFTPSVLSSCALWFHYVHLPWDTICRALLKPRTEKLGFIPCQKARSCTGVSQEPKESAGPGPFSTITVAEDWLFKLSKWGTLQWTKGRIKRYTVSNPWL